jgi:hypothetical protein
MRRRVAVAMTTLALVRSLRLETGVSPAPDGESSLARDIFANYWTFVGASASAALI